MTKKCIFLTGATGYLGSNLLPEFVKNGYKLKLLVRPQKMNPHERVVQSLSKIDNKQLTVNQIMQNIEIFEGDIIKKNLGLTETVIRNLSKEVTDVFHCAAAVSFDEEKESLLRKHNINGTKNILSFTDMLDNAHLHYMSTAYVCGRKNGIVKEDEFDDKRGFNNSYEKIKHAAELLVKSWENKYQAKTIIYRPSVIIGDSDTGKNLSSYGLYGMFKTVDIGMRKLKIEFKKGNPYLKNAGIKLSGDTFFVPLRVLGNLNKTINLITIDYATRAIIHIFNNADSIGKAYHITNSSPPTMKVLKDCMCKVLKVTGTEFVLPKDIRNNPVKIWEKQFNEGLKLYSPYLLLDEPVFDDANTKNILRNTYVSQAKIDEVLITKLLTYCYSTKYGKISNPPDK